MSGSIESLVVDTGPIVAVLLAGDQHHAWAVDAFGKLTPPLTTCESVVSEAQFVLRRLGGDPIKVLELLRAGLLEIDFSLQSELDRILELQRSYRNVPMSLADACIVRMSELRPRCRVMTTDSDFRIYRRNRRNVIPLLAPPGM